MYIKSREKGYTWHMHRLACLKPLAILELSVKLDAKQNKKNI